MADRLSPLMRRVAEALSPGASIAFGGGADAVAHDDVLLRRMVEGAGPETITRLWINDPCLVTTRRLANSSLFQAACTRSEDFGWPVHVRTSGGSTVVHRPGILNVSVLCRSGAPQRIEQYYEPLVALLVSGLGALGLQIATGRCEGSYCDGAYNLLAGGRKIAGTSCRVIRSGCTLAYLTHAVLWVEGNLAQDIAAISRFETALGINAHYALDRHATLQAALQ